MKRFVQIHMLTSYPPSNLNRDDLGRPKSAVMGGAQRLRISSQSLKRAWRTSDGFMESVKGHVGTRTKELGNQVAERLADAVGTKKAQEWAKEIAAVFGKLKKNSTEIEQLAHLSPEEMRAVDDLVTRLAEERKKPQPEDLELLRAEHSAVDIAMFGRMLAARPVYNVEAAVQVSHAITVHDAAVEDDYFTAVDDLNRGDEDRGAAHVGEAEFGAGLFYTYICVDTGQLLDNLEDEELAARSIRALATAAATVPPGGKQNSFASRAYAMYMLAEKGEAQPRSLAAAFLKPVRGTDHLGDAIAAIEHTRQQLDQAYGGDGTSYTMNVSTGEGTLSELVDFCVSE